MRSRASSQPGPSDTGVDGKMYCITFCFTSDARRCLRALLSEPVPVLAFHPVTFGNNLHTKVRRQQARQHVVHVRREAWRNRRRTVRACMHVQDSDRTSPPLTCHTCRLNSQNQGLPTSCQPAFGMHATSSISGAYTSAQNGTKRPSWRRGMFTSVGIVACGIVACGIVACEMCHRQSADVGVFRIRVAALEQSFGQT